MILHLNKKFIAFMVLGILFAALVFPIVSKKDSVSADTDVDTAEIKLPVLMYHHILKDSSKRGDYVVTCEQFEDDLRYIQQKGYHTVSLSELEDFINGNGSIPQNSVLITFDDGFESFYTYAFPLLKKYNAKAIVSVIGKYTDIFSNPEEPHGINYSHLSWEEIKELNSSGLVEIGNHTYNMHGERNTARFGVRKKQSESTEQYKQALVDDIGGLNLEISENIGKTPRVFAYPFGAMTKESKEVLNELNFKFILTCEEKVNIIKQGCEYPCYLKRFNRASKYQTFKYFNKMGL